MSVTVTGLGVILVVTAVAGAINGIAGFGFAIVGTMILATVLDPSTAVVFMIVPIVAVNLSLARELSATQLRTCGRRFGPLILSALVGTVIGMVVLERVPAAQLKVGLGLIALAFVVSVQGAVTIPGLDVAKAGCFVEAPLAMVGVGGVSGLLFGGTNVGVQLVAYLRSCDLSHGLFVGVVAMVFLGLNGVRIGIAGLLGLYPALDIFVISIGAIVPAVAGVTIGSRLRDRVDAHTRRTTVLGLITVIGGRLVLAGVGVA